MPALVVERSIVVNAPADRVFPVVRDFHRAPAWSPWLIADPECEVQIADDNSRYAWNGRIVGAGELAIDGEEPLQRILHRLTFRKPWKSTARVEIALSPEVGGSTAVTWTMTGTLPVLFFWMRRMMTAVIGMDYERGLRMLKDLVESGSVPSRLEFPGVQSVRGTRFIGIRTRCLIDDVGPRMEDAFRELRRWAPDHGFGSAAEQAPFAIYHAWDVVSRTTEFTAAVPVDEVPAGLPPRIESGDRPTCEAYTIRHTGPYRHLGNAWAAGMMRGRARTFEQSRRIDPFEVYESAPAGRDTETENPVTKVHFPVR